MSKESSKEPTVTVFGAGIAGLTAAHELAERNFRVLVVERDVDWESAKANVPCAIGGMAKSQWAWLDSSSPSAGLKGVTLPQQARRAFHFDRIFALDAEGVWAELEHQLKCFGGPVRVEVRGAPADSQRAEARLKALPLPVEVIAAPTSPMRQQAAPANASATAPSGSWPQIPAGHVELKVNPGSGSQKADSPTRVFPAEHGFRFFPGFYRHVFDTMLRTPLSTPELGQSELGQPGPAQTDRAAAGPYDRPVRTVFDNLVPTSESGLGLTGRSRNYALEYPRKPPTSVREILDTLEAFMKGGGYKAADIARFSLKLFQYMTTSNVRRQQEFENISWWDFIEGESFAQPMRHDLDVAPAVLGAMVARKSDARTQGSVSVQLLLDQLGHSPRTDALLNGPTTEAWFKPWREYLAYRGVQFVQGELTGFKLDEAAQRIRPVAKLADPEQSAWADYYVVATALPDLTGRPTETDPTGPLLPGLAAKFVECCKQLRTLPACLQSAAGAGSATGGATENAGDESESDARDFWSLAQLDTGNWNASDQSLLQHLIGVQYFFAYNDRQFTGGHSVYLDSEWRLSAISQTRFWRRPPGEMDGFDGILSVDIGDVWRETKFVSVDVSCKPPSAIEVNRRCWGATAADITCGTFAQILAASPDNDPLPRTVCFHLDQGLHFDAHGKLVGNTTPYLVNRPGEWHKRPGRIDERKVGSREPLPGEKLPRGYDPQVYDWFLCGTFMKTHTRLTTMEAANESARHAVNGILAQQRRKAGEAAPSVDPCETWNIEEHEPPDLRWLKELDEKLFVAGHPHLIEILSLDKIPEALLPTLKHVYEPLQSLLEKQRGAV